MTALKNIFSQRRVLWHDDSPGVKMEVNLRFPRTLMKPDFATSAEILREYRNTGIGNSRIAKRVRRQRERDLESGRTAETLRIASERIAR